MDFVELSPRKSNKKMIAHDVAICCLSVETANVAICRVSVEIADVEICRLKCSYWSCNLAVFLLIAVFPLMLVKTKDWWMLSRVSRSKFVNIAKVRFDSSHLKPNGRARRQCEKHSSVFDQLLYSESALVERDPQSSFANFLQLSDRSSREGRGRSRRPFRCLLINSYKLSHLVLT